MNRQQTHSILVVGLDLGGLLLLQLGKEIEKTTNAGELLLCTEWPFIITASVALVALFATSV